MTKNPKIKKPTSKPVLEDTKKSKKSDVEKLEEVIPEEKKPEETKPVEEKKVTKRKKKEPKMKYWVVSIANCEYKKPKGDIYDETQIAQVVDDLIQRGIRFSCQSSDKKKIIRKQNKWSVYMSERMSEYKTKNKIEKLKAAKRNELMKEFATDWKKLKPVVPTAPIEPVVEKKKVD
jgi:hypothetical protein